MRQRFTCQQNTQSLKTLKVLKLLYLGLSGLGGLSMKLLFVTFEMGIDGTFFSDRAGAKGQYM